LFLVHTRVAKSTKPEAAERRKVSTSYWIVLLVVVLVVCVLTFFVFRRETVFATPGQAATFDVLHAANLAAPHLRLGFSAESLNKAIPHLRSLLGTPSLGVVGPGTVLAFDGNDHHKSITQRLGEAVIDTGATGVETIQCGQEGCLIRSAISVPVTRGEAIIGALVAFDATGGPGLIRSMTEVATWVSSQIELAEFDEYRARLARAELVALRAQISPHFIFNALTAIASFTRTDPERARDLLVEFADFTRYSLSNRGAFTTVAEELRCIERYLALEQARFGDRLHVRLDVAPEILPVVIPFLVLQPLVENAVRHGIEQHSSTGLLEISAVEISNECVITIEDNGVGADPDALQLLMDGHDDTSQHIGLRNVDERLRAVFGPTYGLHIETAIGAGTKVTVRVPKYRPGVRP
jgi:two-component system, LytTR family, sensor kinase